MAEKGEDAVEIDGMWSEPPAAVTNTPAPVADAASDAPDPLPPAILAPSSEPDLPPPPAQLLTALTEFEAAGPESFRAVTTSSAELPPTAAAIDTALFEPRASRVVPTRLHLLGRLFATRRARIVSAAALAGGVCLMGAIWMSSAVRKPSRAESSPAAARAAASSSGPEILSASPNAVVAATPDEVAATSAGAANACALSG